MILVDIEVPSVEMTYDFELDENVPLALLIGEIGEMIAQKLQVTQKETQLLILCDKKSGQILPFNLTLAQCGIVNGSPLMIL